MNGAIAARPRPGEAADPAGQGAKRYFVAILLMLIYAASFTDRQVFSLLIAPIQRDLHLTDTQIGLIAGPAFVILHVAAVLPFGWLVDRWNRRNIILLTTCFWSMMTAACGFAGSFWNLGLARAGIGIGEAAVAPASYSILTDYFPKSQMARGLSIYGMGVPLGGCIALIGGGWMIGQLSAMGTVTLPFVGTVQPWQMVFLILALPGVPLALAMTAVPEPSRRPSFETDGADVPSLMEVFRFIGTHFRLYAGIYLGVALLATFTYGVSYWLPTTLQRVHGLSVAQSGFFMGASILLFSLPGTLCAGWLSDWLTRKGWTDGPLIVGMGYASGLLVFVGIGPIITPHWLGLGMMSIGMFFFNSWAPGVAPAILQQISPTRMRGRVSATFVMFVNLVGLGLGPVLVALLTEHLLHGRAAIGEALTILAFATVPLAILSMNMCRRQLRAAASSDDDLQQA